MGHKAPRSQGTAVTRQRGNKNARDKVTKQVLGIGLAWCGNCQGTSGEYFDAIQRLPAPYMAIVFAIPQICEAIGVLTGSTKIKNISGAVANYFLSCIFFIPLSACIFFASSHSDHHAEA